MHSCALAVVCCVGLRCGCALLCYLFVVVICDCIVLVICDWACDL